MKLKAALRKAASIEHELQTKMVKSDNNAENENKFNNLLRYKNRPLVVIVTPGRELAEQTYQTAIKLNKSAKLNALEEIKQKHEDNHLNEDSLQKPNNSETVQGLDLSIKLVLGGNVDKRLETESKTRVDILIGTVGALSKMFRAHHYYAGSVCSLVFDEADSLLDETFGDLTAGLMAKLCRIHPDVREALSVGSSSLGLDVQNEEVGVGETQVIFVGATMPSDISSSPVGSLVESEQLRTLRTGLLHRVLPHIRQTFIRSPKVNRQEYLARVIEEDIKKGRSVIVFSNKASTANFIAHFINERFGSTNSTVVAKDSQLH